jgi:hypothetical protein
MALQLSQICYPQGVPSSHATPSKVAPLFAPTAQFILPTMPSGEDPRRQLMLPTVPPTTTKAHVMPVVLHQVQVQRQPDIIADMARDLLALACRLHLQASGGGGREGGEGGGGGRAPVCHEAVLCCHLGHRGVWHSSVKRVMALQPNFSGSFQYTYMAASKSANARSKDSSG